MHSACWERAFRDWGSTKSSKPGPVREVQESAFYRLPRDGDALVEALRKKDDVAAAAMVRKSTVGDCRAELANIVEHLNARGVNLDIVYALDVIEKSLARMEIISGVLVAQPGQPKLLTAQRLMKEVIRGARGGSAACGTWHITVSGCSPGRLSNGPEKRRRTLHYVEP